MIILHILLLLFTFTFTFYMFQLKKHVKKYGTCIRNELVIS